MYHHQTFSKLFRFHLFLFNERSIRTGRACRLKIVLINTSYCSHNVFNIFLVYVILNLYIMYTVVLLYSNYHFHLFSICFAFPSEMLA